MRIGTSRVAVRRRLRRLRNDAGLTVLAAAEATGYSKYARWESGQTQVGGQYLTTIADVFGVADDLHLLVYAWLLDRLTPDAGEPSRTLNLDELRRHLRNAPEARVDLGEHAHLVLESGRHVDVALFLMAARYGDQRVVVVPAVHRQPLPRPANEFSEFTFGFASTQEVTTFDSAPVGLLLRQPLPVRDLPVVPFDAAI